MADYPFFSDAKLQLETEMTDRQKRLINILTGIGRCESTVEKELLESEIEDRKTSLEKLEAQRCCESCGTQVDERETLRIQMTRYREKLPTVNLPIERVRIRVKCTNCYRRMDDIIGAIEMLSRKQWQNLGRVGWGNDREDLVQDALVSTLAGTENTKAGRQWKKSDVDFFGYLRGAVRSISSHREQSRRREAILESDLITRNAEGDEISPLENVASSDPGADQCLIAKEAIERKFKVFASDREAIAVLQARLEGIPARDIMKQHDLTRQRYGAALWRLRCQKSALVIEDHDQVLGLLARWLKPMGYAVLTASSANEGLRLYGECGPFDIVVISYSPNLHGVELAEDILKNNPSQRLIITKIGRNEDVVYPSGLIHIPILPKPFGRSELHTALSSFASTARERPADCFRPQRRRGYSKKVNAALRGRERTKAAKTAESS
jgi:CheY-like chemotaxis protein/DNA-directed RNA polymerase specialized sigma24 family protein